MQLFHVTHCNATVVDFIKHPISACQSEEFYPRGNERTIWEKNFLIQPISSYGLFTENTAGLIFSFKQINWFVAPCLQKYIVMEDNHNDNFGALSYNNAISRVLFGVINVFCYIEYLPMNAPSRKIRLIGTAMYRIFVTMYIMVRNFPYELPRFTFCYKQKVLVFKSDALKDQIQFIMNVTFFSYSPLNSRCFAVCFRWH